MIGVTEDIPDEIKKSDSTANFAPNILTGGRIFLDYEYGELRCLITAIDGANPIEISSGIFKLGTLKVDIAPYIKQRRSSKVVDHIDTSQREVLNSIIHFLLTSKVTNELKAFLPRFLHLEQPQRRTDHFAYGGEPAGLHLLGHERFEVVAQENGCVLAHGSVINAKIP